MAKHSVYNELSKSFSYACGIPKLLFKEKKVPDMDHLKLKSEDLQQDIIEEALIYFRANTLFKNFQILGDADKLLIYITVFISKCLEVISLDPEEKKATANLNSLISEAEWYPNKPNYFFNNLVTLVNSEVADLQSYLKSIRKETVYRLMYLLYGSEAGTMDLKYWLSFSRKKFLGYDIVSKK
jgi:actin related protein 2/3 complex subunit 3